MGSEIVGPSSSSRAFRHRSISFVFLLILSCAQLSAFPKAAALELKDPVYQDPQTKITFYIESDRHHVAAISSKGKLLWVRNPFMDGRLENYRGANSPIYSIGKANTGYEKQIDGKAKFIRVDFVSTQFGIMDQATGFFHYLGRN